MSTTQKPVRPNKDDVAGLPEHAQFQYRQGKWYVYFPYCFRDDGRRQQERDYIGKLSDDGKAFVPNLYYVQNEPEFDRRPPERWKNSAMRKRALEKAKMAQEDQALETGADLDPEIDTSQQHSVGATCICRLA